MLQATASKGTDVVEFLFSLFLLLDLALTYVWEKPDYILQNCTELVTRTRTPTLAYPTLASAKDSGTPRTQVTEPPVNWNHRLQYPQVSAVAQNLR